MEEIDSYKASVRGFIIKSIEANPLSGLARSALASALRSTDFI